MLKFAKKLADGHAENSNTAVFIGDSVTAGYFESIAGMHGITDCNAVYHNLFRISISNIFPHKRLNIINSGIGGDCASEAVKRLEKDVGAYSPDITVVNFGLNDINKEKNEYVKSLAEIFQYLKYIKSEAIFMTPNTLNFYVSPLIKDAGLKKIAGVYAQKQLTGQMDEYIYSAIETANENKVAVCDCYSKWKMLSDIGTDTTALLANHINHPCREMHTLFSQSLLNTVFFNGDLK